MVGQLLQQMVASGNGRWSG